MYNHLRGSSNGLLRFACESGDEGGGSRKSGEGFK
jgi:hypothetical protein